MRDVLNSAVLVIVPVFHFLEDVALVLFELADSIHFDLANLVTLSLQLSVELVDKLALLLLSLFLLELDGFFNLSRVLCEVLENFTLFLHTSVLLGLQVGKVLVHLCVDRVELIVQGSDAVVALFRK